MSTIKVDNLQTSSGAGFYPAKVWVNFNGTSTVAIRDDGNVSSITDTGAGMYQANFTTGFSTTSYCVAGCIQAVGGNGGAQVSCLVSSVASSISIQTSSVSVIAVTNLFETNDTPYVFVSVTQ